MKLGMQRAAALTDLSVPRWSVAFRGGAIDPRGTAAVECVTTRATRVVSLSYEPDSFEVEIDGAISDADVLPDSLRTLADEHMVLEATTLGFVEILLCCRAFRKLGVSSFDVLYVEPVTYTNPRRGVLLHRRDFELSDLVPGYRAIPGFGMLLGDRAPQRGVFFLGYEDARLRRALEDLQMIQAQRATLAFGVPAFQPGWEMDAIANNIGIVKEQNLRGGVYFCGADNPAGAMDILSQVQLGLAANERMFVAPIGTKPHGIGVALFASTTDAVRVIYDHPSRTPGRTDSIAKWHLFTVTEY